MTAERPLSEWQMRLKNASDFVLSSVKQEEQDALSVVGNAINQGISEVNVKAAIWSLYSSGLIDLSWDGIIKKTPEETTTEI